MKMGDHKNKMIKSFKSLTFVKCSLFRNFYFTNDVFGNYLKVIYQNICPRLAKGRAGG